MAVQVNDGAEGEAILLNLTDRGPVRSAVVPLGMAHVVEGQLVDSEIRRLPVAGGQAAAGRFPFGENAGILLLALLRVVLAEQYVVALAEGIGERDDGLA